MDKLDQITAFTTTIDAGSVTAAARRLQVAPSAVSRRIKELETRLGTQLLQRTTRTMRLTATGETFLARARQILDDLEAAEREAGDTQTALSGPLRLSIPVSFGATQLNPVISDFALQHPGVVLDIDMSDRMVDLVAEGYDLAVRIGQLRDSSLIARKLAEIRIAVAAAPAFWKRHGRPSAPEDLRDLPALCYTGGGRGDLLRYRTELGQSVSLPLNVAMQSNNGDLLRHAAIAGRGWVIQPSFLLGGAIDAGDLAPVLTGVDWPRLSISVVYPGTRHLPAKARAFIEFLRARLTPPFAWEAFLDEA